MTSRRSLQTDAMRSSRAFQFVPGHVGGRVASAQPVRRRAMVGAVSRIPGTAPDGLRTSLADILIHGVEPTLDLPYLPPADTTTVVGMFYSTTYTDIALPAGWTVLASGSHGTAVQSWVIGTTRSAAAGAAHFSATVANVYSTAAYALAFFKGGSAEGTWTVVDGPTYEGISLAGFAAVPEGSQAWAQFAAATGVYTVSSSPDGVSTLQGIAGGYIYPAIGVDYEGAAFAAAMASPKSSSTVWDYRNIGAYGTPDSISFAVAWTG